VEQARPRPRNNEQGGTMEPAGRKGLSNTWRIFTMMERIMEKEHFGVEQITEEDRVYDGSRYGEVRDAIFANPYQKVWGGADEPPLPNYEVTLSSVLRGLLPFGRLYPLRQASERTVDSRADLRWGPDRNGFRRLQHPSGVCLTGLWEITKETEYSGYFRRGSRALVSLIEWYLV
jgi:hypothetical protein